MLGGAVTTTPTIATITSGDMLIVETGSRVLALRFGSSKKLLGKYTSWRPVADKRIM